MIVVLVFAVLIGAAAYFVGVSTGVFALIFGPSINRGARLNKMEQDFLVKFGRTTEEECIYQAHSAGMTPGRWKHLPIEEKHLIILSWDLDGQHGGPTLSPAEMQWRREYKASAEARHLKQRNRLRAKRGLPLIAPA